MVDTLFGNVQIDDICIIFFIQPFDIISAVYLHSGSNLYTTTLELTSGSAVVP